MKPLYCIALALLLAACTTFKLDYDTPVELNLQQRIEKIDTRLRAKYGMTTEQTAVGLLDLRRPRVAMIHPDRITRRRI